jgi:hypothetical protein
MLTLRNVPDAVWVGLGICFLVAFVFVVGWSSAQPPHQIAIKAATLGVENKTFQDIAAETVAYYTKMLAWFTAVLASSTIGLWIVTWRSGVRQSRETQILQRAYISINLAGINPYRTREESVGHPVLGHVDIVNVGKLPARDVSCCVKIEMSHSDVRHEFLITDRDFFGNFVLPPGAHMRHGTQMIDWNETLLWVYVWGEVRYLDGFGKKRWTKFCHRYPRIMMHKINAGFGVELTHGRFHLTGNNTDEDYSAAVHATSGADG